MPEIGYNQKLEVNTEQNVFVASGQILVATQDGEIIAGGTIPPGYNFRGWVVIRGELEPTGD